MLTLIILLVVIKYSISSGTYIVKSKDNFTVEMFVYISAHMGLSIIFFHYRHLLFILKICGFFFFCEAIENEVELIVLKTSIMKSIILIATQLIVFSAPFLYIFFTWFSAIIVSTNLVSSSPTSLSCKISKIDFLSQTISGIRLFSFWSIAIMRFKQFWFHSTT